MRAKISHAFRSPRAPWLTTARSSGRTIARRIRSSHLIVERFASRDPYARIAVAILRLIFGDAYADEFGVRLWDGTRVQGSRERFVLRIDAPGALRAALTPPVDLSVGRAFGSGLLGIEGDLETAVD